ncbi:lipoyl(octanoyl) transferase LipB [bacterium]|nr:MAG: lipoyl(octanoyl) transferase LipB [bacterium]
MKKVLHVDLGKIDYQACWDLQKQIQAKIMQEKRAFQKGLMQNEDRLPDVLLFVEHPHVYTLGKSGSESNLLANEAFLKQIEATYVPIDRGGDITYHGPGQLVGYPILDLDRYFTDLHKYLRYLEEIMIQVCADYGFDAGRKESLTGTWVGEEKICAMGVKCSRWVTLHGFALNMNPNLEYFNYIVPCGITDKGVTSLEKLSGKKVNEQDVKEKVLTHFSRLFEVEIEQITLQDLLSRIQE